MKNEGYINGNERFIMQLEDVINKLLDIKDEELYSIRRTLSSGSSIMESHLAQLEGEDYVILHNARERIDAAEGFLSDAEGIFINLVEALENAQLNISRSSGFLR